MRTHILHPAVTLYICPANGQAGELGPACRLLAEMSKPAPHRLTWSSSRPPRAVGQERRVPAAGWPDEQCVLPSPCP
jgi:hypothetical protein